MQLLSTNADGSFSLTRFIGNSLPNYAILSHTWEADDQENQYKAGDSAGDGRRGAERGVVRIGGRADAVDAAGRRVELLQSWLRGRGLRCCGRLRVAARAGTTLLSAQVRA